MIKKILLFTLSALCLNAFAEESWTRLNSPSISTDIIEFINSKSKNNWDTVETLSVEKLDHPYQNIYRGKFKFGKSMRTKCIKFGAKCDPDSYQYTCVNVTVEKINNYLHVNEWKKEDCSTFY